MRLIYLWCCCIFSMQMMAQTSTHKNGLSYKFVLTDYNTLDPIFQGSNPGRILHADDLNYAGEIGFFRNINKSLNIGLPLRIGSMDSHHLVFEEGDSLCQPCIQRKRNELFFGGDIVAVYKFNNDYILKEDFLIAPYILLGIGGVYMSQREGQFDFQIPMGLGVNIKLTELLYLQAQFEYRKSLVIQKDNFAISAGISWLLASKEKSESNLD